MIRRAVLWLPFVVARVHTEEKVLNDHWANLSAPHIKDREALYVPSEPGWLIGKGRKVAIVDIGMPKNDSFFWCTRVGAAAKVVFEIDTQLPGQPVRRDMPKHLNNCSDRRSLFERPMISNHLTKSIIYGYYAPSAEPDRLAAPSVPAGMAIATGVQLVSIVFRKWLYVHEAEKHHVRKRADIDTESALTYLESLVRASTWLVLHAKEHQICSVQISAVDGLSVEPDWYARLSQPAYERWELNTLEIKRAGVWASAPAGNQDVKNESAVFNWPASDPNVIGVGCYSYDTQTIVRQRGPGLDILVASMEDHPPTSYCNTLAVATSVTVRDICEAQCAHIRHHPGCSAAFTLFAMQYTGIVLPDPRSSLSFFALVPDRLFAYVNSSQVCDDAHQLLRSPVAREALLARLPFRTAYFAASDWGP